jgi:predicted PurR-regulated permease PerM
MGQGPAILNWERALVVLTGTVVGVVIVAALYWAQIVFIPLALAIFMTFLLTPAVRSLQRRGLGRIPSVTVVVLFAALLLGALSWLVASQVTGLLNDLPQYSANITAKVKALRELISGPEELEKMIEEVKRRAIKAALRP